MNRSGAGQQPLRATAGNVFVNQQQAQARNAALGSGRLQNAKIASSSGAGWSGMSMAGALQQNQQARPTNTGMANSFAATIGGGSHSQTPLDLSEFPSLSRTPQHQQPHPGSSNPAQAIWNAGGRAGSIGPQQRTSDAATQQASAAPGAPIASQQQRSEQARDSLTSPFPQMHNGDFRMQGLHTNNDEYGHASGGLDGVDAASVRKVGTDGANSNDEGHADDGSRLRSHDASVMTRGPARSNTNPFGQPPGAIPQVANTLGSHGQGFSPTPEGTNNQSTLSEMEKWGLPGLLETLRGPYPDQTALALGMDLNTLGLDLNRPGEQPLYADWGGPFADPRRPVVPEFRLPDTYNVRNVPPLDTKISSFSDETLFAIFYQYPRDIRQEMAANELYGRDWRWHKKLQQWMMKAKEMGEPQILASEKEERGFYYFFDTITWQRDRKEFILNYEHLYHHRPVQPVQAVQQQQGQQQQPQPQHQ